MDNKRKRKIEARRARMGRCALAGVAVLAMVVALAPPGLSSPGRTERVSMGISGTEPDSHSGSPSVSADGRYIAFESLASNLVLGDANGVKDVFVFDRETGATERVSVASDGTQGALASALPSASADGRYVAFFSDAPNLVAGDTNNFADVFVHDRETGTTERVSVGTGGTQGNQSSSISSVSADGRYIAFQSAASNLVAEDFNNRADVFVHDRETGTTERVSVGTGGTQGSNFSSDPSISADGRYVAFASFATNLVSGDDNDTGDVFVHDRETGVTERVSVASDGTEGNAVSFDPRISADGRYVAFSSLASSLAPGDINETFDVFVHDRQTGATERVSVTSDGAAGNDRSHSPSVSADGRHIGFSSSASDLVSGDTNGTSDVFVYDRETGTTSRVSVSSDGAEGNGGSSAQSLSADGTYIGFSSSASNLVSGDTNGRSDVFVRVMGDTPSPIPVPSPSRGTYPLLPNDPYFGAPSTGPTDIRPNQWGLKKIQAPGAWQEFRATGFGIGVAVLDSGVDLQHEDLQCSGKLEVAPGTDVVGKDSNPDDENGHGTHVAGIIGACTNNGTGVAGVAPDATIVPVRVLNGAVVSGCYPRNCAAGNGIDAHLIAGLNRARQLGVHVINLSLGYPPGKEIINDVSEIDAAIEATTNAGTVIVAAAGNEALPLCAYPSLAEDIICVGATDPRDLKSWYSNFAFKPSGPSIVAPGGTEPVVCDAHSESILSLYPAELDGCNEGLSGYRDLNGTSMASPHVAGVAALVYDRLGGARSAENAGAVIDAIVGTTDDLGAPGYDPVFGSGRVNALKAVQSIAVVDPGPTPTPTDSPSATPTESGSPSPSASSQPETATVALTDRSAESGQYSDETLFEARITDSGGAPLEGRELTFELIGADSSRSFSATTDEDGVASVSPTLEERPGSHELTVRFAGDEDHAGDADTVSFVVDKEDSALELSVAGEDDDKTLRARLSDLDTSSEGIADRTIDFYSDGELIGSGITDADGVASFALPPATAVTTVAMRPSSKVTTSTSGHPTRGPARARVERVVTVVATAAAELEMKALALTQAGCC